MGNTFISYFFQTSSQTSSECEDNSEQDKVEVLEGERNVVSVEGDEKVLELDERCVAWEIDVTNWRPRKKKRGRVKPLKETDINIRVGGADEAKLVRVTLLQAKTEVRMAQYSDDIKEKKVLDIKRW